MSDLIKQFNDLISLSERQQAVFALMKQLNIEQTTYQHPPIFTVEEGMALGLHDHIPGQGGKSLLLTNKNNALWLVVACDNTRVDIKGLANKLNSGRLSFAKPEIMEKTMGVTPGSATPFALMQDTERQIQVVIDKGFAAHSHCVFHPLKNNLSTVIQFNDLLRFIEHLGYRPLVTTLTAPVSPA